MRRAAPRLKAFTPVLRAGYVCCGLLLDLTFLVLIFYLVPNVLQSPGSSQLW